MDSRDLSRQGIRWPDGISETRAASQIAVLIAYVRDQRQKMHKLLPVHLALQHGGC